MAERIPEIGDTPISAETGEQMLSIHQMMDIGKSWKEIAQIAYIAALRTALAHPGLTPYTYEELVEQHKDMYKNKPVDESYWMARWSETPDRARKRRIQEKEDHERERRVRGDMIYYDWIW